MPEQKLIETDVEVTHLENILNNPSYGEDYYVDSNAGSNANDGLTWATAFATLAYAITQSNAFIAASSRGWAARNRIFYKGDNNAESITVLPEKCDIIGVGSGGGWMPKAQIVGTHVIGSAANGGCHIYNMGFSPTTAADNIFAVPATTIGLEFHNCRFDAVIGGGYAGSAVVITGSAHVRFFNCTFEGQFSDSVIEVVSGNVRGLTIKGCYIEGANEGIEIKTGVTASPQHILIQDNTIRVATIGINDVDKIATVKGNFISTLQARGINCAGAIVASVDFSANNRLNCADGSNIEWPIPPSLNPSGGRDYYVDSNAGSAANGGSSWDDALDTLTAAMALSHAWIASGSAGWAARNRIFYKGDSNSEDLTTLAQKTDIIGVGSGGGWMPKAQIVGTHVIGAGAYIGCHFYNMGFAPKTAADNIFAIPATTIGLEFHECDFDSVIGGGHAGSALVITGAAHLIIDKCNFIGQYSDATIEVVSGNVRGLHVKGCYIEGANDGIEIKTGVTASHQHTLIKDNILRTGTICINDVDGIATIVGNRGITGNAKGASLAGAVIGSTGYAMDNRFCTSDADNVVWPANGAI